MYPIELEKKSIKDRFNEFFYREEVPFGTALVRMALPFVLLLTVAIRWPWSRELFSSDGAPAPLWVGYGFPDLVPLMPGTIAVAMHTALIICLVCSIIGWRTRFSLIGATVLYTYLSACDAMSTMTKYSVISSHILFLLALSNCGAIWSVDSWLKRRKADKQGLTIDSYPKSAVWPRRLMQLFIAIVYFGAAITKLHTSGYLNGDQMLQWQLTNINNHNPFGEFLTLFPGIIVMMAYIAIIWEVLFIATVWTRPGRFLMLGLGVTFHLATTFVLGLYIFPLICISIYFSYVNEHDVQRYARLWRRCCRKFSWLKSIRFSLPTLNKPVPGIQSSAIYGTMFCLLVTGGVALEGWLDIYGHNRAEGAYTLRELDPEYVDMMIGSSSEQLEEIDKLFSFEVGTMTLGPRLLYQQYEYEHGDSLIAQCYFIPPHEDMWLECNLHDDKDQLIDRIQALVSRENNCVNFYYTMGGATTPGNYDLVVLSKGKELTRKTITITDPENRAAAN